MAATIASLVAQPLAGRIQEDITTTPDVEGLSIQGVTRHEYGSRVFHKITVGQG